VYEPLPIPSRIGVLGDTHLSNRRRIDLPQRMLDDFSTCDLILHTGDISANWVLERLGEIGPVWAVAGNNEEADLAGSLPAEVLIQAGSWRIGMVHGHAGPATGRLNALATLQGRVDCIVYGHSHQPEIVERDGLLLVNPGSPTQRRYAPHHTYAVMDINEEIVPRLIRLD
jgi:hypothetical protein